MLLLLSTWESLLAFVTPMGYSLFCILEAFGWLLPCFNNNFDLLASLLVGHLFGGPKKRFGWLFCKRSLGLFGLNTMAVFLERFSSFDRSLDLVLSNVFFFGAKLSTFLLISVYLI